MNGAYGVKRSSLSSLSAPKVLIGRSLRAWRSTEGLWWGSVGCPAAPVGEPACHNAGSVSRRV